MAFDDSASGDLFAPAPGGGQGPLDVRKLLGTLRRFYWVFIPAVLLAVAGALAYMKTVKPVFRSSATIKVERRSATAVTNSEAAALQGATTPEDLRTIERSFFSPGLMKRVVEKLNLRKRDNFIGPGRPASTVTEDELYGYLGEHCQVELVPDTRLIQVSFDSWNPQLAEEVANTIMREGVIYDREQRVEALSGNVKYLESERIRLEENLKRSEEKLNDYTRQTGSVSIDDELNIVATQLRDLNNRHTIAKAERLKLESDYEQIQAVRDDADKLLDIESIRKVPAVERLYARAGELRSQLVKLAQKYRPANPVIIQTETEIKEVDASLKQEILQAPKSIEVALAAARRNEESLAREEAAQEKRVIDTKELSVKSQVLQRQIEADRIAYEATLKRLNEELAQVRSQPVLLQPVDPAGPGYQTSIRKSKVLAGGVIAGLLLGAGIIFLIMQLDTSVKTVEDAEGTFKLSVLAAVPVYEPGADPGQKAGAAVLSDLAHAPVIRDPHSTVAEAFRSLRAAVELGDDAAPQRGLILVTSAVPGEGKSLCALNLAIALAQSGQRTLLVDAQLRSPVLEERVFAARGGNGLADYLQGTVQFPSVIRATNVPNLDVVTAGSHARHPAEILSRPRFPEFLDAARAHYDRVVFDTASVTSVSDTLSFARFFPLVCVVVRAGVTARGSVERTLELISRAGAKPHGLVLNFARDKFSFSYAGAGAAGEKDLDFPKACPSCGHVFLDFNDYLAGTRPGEKSTAPAQLARLCRQCGAAVVVAADNRRDDTQAGRQRRNFFGELHEHLVQGGMPGEEARAKLLLTLKIGRHETFSDENGGTTGAGRRRHHLFDELLETLTRAGWSREDARARLLKAIQDWRGVS